LFLNEKSNHENHERHERVTFFVLFVSFVVMFCPFDLFSYSVALMDSSKLQQSRKTTPIG